MTDDGARGARGARDSLDMIGPHTVVWRERTDFFDAAIVDTPSLGRALFLDGVLQSAALDERRYHHALVRPGLRRLAPTGPRDVLILGAGEGATIRDVLRCDTVEHVLTVDIDARLHAGIRKHLSQWHAGAFDDPRVTMKIEDARRTIAEAEDHVFDLIIVDLTDPPDEPLDASAATAPLIDLAFARALRRVLRPHGVMTVQVGEADPPSAAAVYSPLPALAEVFRHVALARVFMESFDTEWAFACAADRAPEPENR